MSHAFQDDILRRRDRRTQQRARLAFWLRRGGLWIGSFLATAVLVCTIIGFAEGRLDLQRVFNWPWQWLPRITGGGDRAIHPLTGAMLVLFCGGWLTLVSIVALQRLLRLGYGPLAVARSVVDESVRNKVVLVLLGLLLLTLAIQPWASLAQGVQQPLRYQIQTFLSFSSFVGTLLLGGVTILFSAYSVSQDIYVRRTGDVFVKPLSRMGYLFGKWLGVVLLMLLVVTVQTVITWGVARLWLGSNGQALDYSDLAAINQRVLVAREEARPLEIGPGGEDLMAAARERLRQAAIAQPELLEQRSRAALLNDYLLQARNEFLTVPYGETRTYVFTGLGAAKQRAEALSAAIQANRDYFAEQLGIPPEQVSLETVAPYGSLIGYDTAAGMLQLRFKIAGYNTFGTHEEIFRLRINGQTLPQPVAAIIDQVQVYDLPASYVDENGRLELQVINDRPNSAGEQRAIQFDAETWMQIYYVEGDFGPNLIRAGLVQWTRLGFLAMLGVVTASLFSYPVAATFSLCLWVLAAGGAYLRDTLSYRVADTEVAAVDTTFNNLFMPVVRTIAALLSRYSDLSASALLVDGRYISWAATASHIFWVGLIWTGALYLFGSYLFSRREIARVQV